MGKIIDPENLQTELSKALLSLTMRTHKTACVLLEDQSTERFVQFGRGPELLLDLPLNNLSESEKARAQEIFSALGAGQSRKLEAPDVNGKPVTRNFEVLQCAFGQDADKAAAAAIKVFQHTYQLYDVVYVLQEN